MRYTASNTIFASEKHLVVQIDPVYVRLCKRNSNRTVEVERTTLQLSFREPKYEVDMYIAQMFNKQYNVKKAIAWEWEGI